MVLLLAPLVAAEILTGTVKNGTTNQPAAGDEVILIKLAQGMEEGPHTKADANGKFSFNLDDQGPHLIRAVHQGVTYHKMAPPGTASIDLQVYDVASKVNDLHVTADVMRFQAQSGQLQGIRLFAVNNASAPPRTQQNNQNFSFYLPDGAEIDQTMAMTAGGQPISSDAIPQKQKNLYAFNYPLRPGETQFQVVYHLAYAGKLTVDPKTLYGAQHFVVMVPKSMTFTPGPGAAFQAMQDPRSSDAVVQVASNTEAGQALTFTISGEGTLTESNGENQNGAAAQAPPSAGRDSRPGGGLGPPIDAPDPLEKYRWYILGGFAVVLAAGGIYITGRRGSPMPDDFSAAGAEVPTQVPRSADASASTQPANSGDRSGLLLEALKEELFQLEVERKQGRISEQEYQSARAALDQTLERALKRETAKSS
jgi:hypothetical protein